MSEKRSLFFQNLISSILAASLLAVIAGLIEALLGMFFGPGIVWTKEPLDIEISLLTRFLYTLFVVSLVAVAFQLFIIFARLLPFPKSRTSLKLAFPPWALFAIIGALALFAGISSDSFEQIHLALIAGMATLYLLFIGACFAAIRAYCKRVPEADGQNEWQISAGHWSRSGALSILFSLGLTLPTNILSVSPLITRAICLAMVLAATPALSWLLAFPFRTLFRQIYISSSLAFPLVAALPVMLAPILLVTFLWPRSVEEKSVKSSSRIQKTSTARADAPNVVILLIDMLRADHVGCYGYERATTPNIDKLANQGVVFRGAFSEASWTLPATVSLLSGLHPTVHGARLAYCSLAAEVETMAEVFSQNGYATGAFVTNPNLKQLFNIGQGFDYYYDDFIGYSYFRSATRNGPLLKNLQAGAEALKLLFLRNEYNSLHTDDIGNATFIYGSERMDIKNVNVKALKWVRKNRRHPFFLYLHYLDVHGPYVQPRKFVESVSHNARENEINYYDGSILYTDGHIGSFIEQLRRLNVLENSIIIITSDHGQEFYEHGRIGHGMSLYDEQLHIPLIVLKTRAFPFHGTFTQPVGLIDVLPTLVDYLGLREENKVDGISLAPLFTAGALPEFPEYRYAETERYNLYRSIRYKNRWKYIYMENALVGQQLFDLENDPLERNNMVDENPALAKDLRNKLDEKYAEFQSRAAATQITAADEQTQHLLKSLGYLN